MATKTATDTSNRGFASMDDQKQRDIASKGGQSVAPEDRSFSKDPDLAAEAGRKGGQHSHGGSSTDDDTKQGGQHSQGSTSTDDDGKQSGRGGNFASDRERAAEAGRKGGERSHGGRS